MIDVSQKAIRTQIDKQKERWPFQENRVPFPRRHGNNRSSWKLRKEPRPLRPDRRNPEENNRHDQDRLPYRVHLSLYRRWTFLAEGLWRAIQSSTLEVRTTWQLLEIGLSWTTYATLSGGTETRWRQQPSTGPETYLQSD